MGTEESKPNFPSCAVLNFQPLQCSEFRQYHTSGPVNIFCRTSTGIDPTTKYTSHTTYYKSSWR